MLWERQVDSWHYEFQREGDEIKYLRKMEGSNVATWNYVKWCRFTSSNFYWYYNKYAS